MKNKIIASIRNIDGIIVFLLFVILFSACTSSDLRVSEFEFNYKNKDYRIRSTYCPGNPESCNQIISEEFIAVDMNQDRIVDEILGGETTLSFAQEVYDYCLALLENQNSLSSIDRENNKYSHYDNIYDYEIKTIALRNKNRINEFTISKKSWLVQDSNKNIFIDKSANGTLDEKIKGDLELKQAQKMYENVVQEGLNKNELIRVNASIIVK